MRSAAIKETKVTNGGFGVIIAGDAFAGRSPCARMGQPPVLRPAPFIFVLERNQLPMDRFRLFACLLLAALLAGCGEKDIDPTIKLLDTEVKVGETQIQTLLDAGFELCQYDSGDWYSIPEDVDLDADSYYGDITVIHGEEIIGDISIVTDEAVPLGEGKVADVIIYNDAPMDRVSYMGTPLSEMTQEKAKELVPGLEDAGDGILNYEKGDYIVRFGYEDDGSFGAMFLSRYYEVEDSE